MKCEKGTAARETLSQTTFVSLINRQTIQLKFSTACVFLMDIVNGIDHPHTKLSLSTHPHIFLNYMIIII